jgi:putative ABC transport system permease protein
VRALQRKLQRDVWHYRSQIGAIALVMACGVAMFVSLRSMYGYLRNRQAAYYADYHFAQLFAQVRRAPLAVADRLRAIPGVEMVEPRVVNHVVLDVPGLEEPATGWLVSIPDLPRPMLNGIVLRSGRYPAPARRDEVVVSDAFARANGLRLTDRLGAVLGGRWETLRIVGTAISPEFIYEIPPGGASLFPDNRRFGVIWMQQSGLAGAFDLVGAFNDVTFTLARDARVPEVIAQVDRILAPYGGTGAYTRKHQVSDQFVSSEIEETQVTSVLLPSVFLGVTAFLLHLVLSRLVGTEREQIAALKAFGYSNPVVALHYLGFAAVPVGLGTLLGTAAGVWLAAWLAGVYARFYQFPDVAYHPDSRVLLGAILVSAGAAMIGTLGAVRRVLALPPAEAMRPETPASFRPGVFDRIGLDRRIPLAARTIFRNIQRRPGRTLLNVTGLALAVALTVSGRFMFDAIDFIKRLQFYDVWRQDVGVGFNRPMEAGVRWELGRLPGVSRVELMRDVPARLRHGQAEERVAVQGLEEQAMLRRIIEPNRAVLPPPAGGLLLTTALASRLHLAAGDSVMVEVLEGRRPVLMLPIAGVVDELLGLGAYMRFDALHRQLREAPVANGALLSVDPRARAALNRRLKRMPAVSSVTWLDALLSGFERTIAESFQISIVSIVVFAVIIAGGVVYNAARLALTERGRELASLRVLGFTRREVALMLLGEQALLTVAAIPLGLAAGHLLSWLVVTRFTSDLFRLPLIISDATRLFAVAVLCLAAAGSAFVIWRRIQRLDLVAVLKTRE